VNLSQRQKEIVIGTLLGDGYLEFDGFKASRLQIKQCEFKKEYVFWLYEELKNLVRTPPKQRKDNQQWYFSTRSLEELDSLRILFYNERRKLVPLTIEKLLVSPLSLAIWFMDDGTLDYRVKSHCSFTLSTDSFSINEVRLLQEVLLKRFEIQSSIQTPSSRGKKYVKLYIGKHGRENFLEIVKPYILSCFNYKLPPIILDPSETKLEVFSKTKSEIYGHSAMYKTPNPISKMGDDIVQPYSDIRIVSQQQR
jgi:hypothetical protein